ncbi:VCBS repeat-containing protein [Streptomyces pactum]|uniref:VCBS repeat-containing protein n=1 Tax=Streptomyces pactum TaxID=68249 RepID=A0ABS0NQJ7_9ACTN|nr:VCBS repeat-containing protein [Streptomyces pactum]MBH5337475.1 VCBS repeat-containing protein [Streptomyces pactum]
MAQTSGRRRGTAVARLTTAAIAAALVGTSAGAAVADTPAPAPASVNGVQQAGERLVGAPSAAPRTVAAPAPVLPLMASVRSGDLYAYEPNGRGGLTSREWVTDSWQSIDASVQVVTGDVYGLYFRTLSGALGYSNGDRTTWLGEDWARYDVLRSVGNLGGAKYADLIARDRSGVLWLYLAKADGTLTGRKKVGPGWGQFTQLAGQGDLTGDGKADLVAADRSGVLWLYKGTGDYTKPFAPRTRIGSGWGQFNHLVSSGDVNLDGRSDLLARDKAGALWLYEGTGKAAAPFKAKKKIGNSGWNQYVQIF